MIMITARTKHSLNQLLIQALSCANMASISLSSSDVAATLDLTPTLPFGAVGASET